MIKQSLLANITLKFIPYSICGIYVCHLYVFTYVKAHPGLKDPSPHASVAHSKIYENVETVYFLQVQNILEIHS